MSKLFSYGDVRNHPHRSGFDLAKRRAFTAKVGEILPVYWKLVLPKDKFNLKLQHFTRTMPVNTAAYTRIKEYFDWYYVPLRLLNKNLTQAFVDMVENPVQATSLTENRTVVKDIPYLPKSTLQTLLCTQAAGADATSLPANLANAYKDDVGFPACASSYKLFSYLSYGNIMNTDDGPQKLGYTTSSRMQSASLAALSFKRVNNPNLNLLPCFAYQKIYCDHFRFEQWEKNQPYTYNFDYYTGGALIQQTSGFTEIVKDYFFGTMRYCNFQKDEFFGQLPAQQLGDIATVDVGEDAYLFVTSSGTANPNRILSATRSSSDTVDIRTPTYTNALVPATQQIKVAQAQFDILSLRFAECLQRYREISQCANQDYKDQIKAHWDVNLSQALSDRCVWIGGESSSIDITEVVNQTLTENSADIKGKGIGSGSSFEEFKASEPGVIMCLYHAIPLLDYIVTGFDPQLGWTSTEDLPKPEFDNIGLQAYYPTYIFDSYPGVEIGGPFPSGYVPRFFELKTSIDDVVGAFTTTLGSWDPGFSINELVLSVSESDLGLDYHNFKVNPVVLNQIFTTAATSAVDTDQLLVNCYIDVKAVRQFDYDGMPY